MTMGSSISVLASFATLKGLSDAKKYSNAYQILAEFIDYIIKTEKLYVFSSIEMKNRLKSQFGFTIPEAVIRATLKKIAYITLSNGIYTADIETMICDDSFEKIKNTTESENFGIMQLLSAYIKESTPGKEIIHEDLERDFIAFLVDDQEKGPGCYTTQIGEFILKNEDNVNIQSSLRAIKEGSILYIGLNYNMNETGSLTKELTLFLGTEVLFGLAGYNGEIHKQLALDLFSLIQSSNLNSKKIKLRFFPEVKREIDGFFSSAESIVDGKLTAFDTAAMSAIINNCDTIVYTGGMDLTTQSTMSQRTNTPMVEIQELPLDKVIVCRRGISSFIDTRYQTYNDELYKNVLALSKDNEHISFAL